MNVFTNLKAYTLPVVKSAIERVGWPARIACQPQPQRGQLKVALAVELAYALASLLGQALSGWHAEKGCPGTVQGEVSELNPLAPTKLQVPKFTPIFGLILNLDRSSFAYTGSPIELLRNREGDWWISFIGYVATQIEADLTGRLYRIAFRDPNMVWTIYQLDRAGCLVGSAAAIDALHTKEKLEQVWRGIDVSGKPPTDGLIRVWKNRLGVEDKEMQEWMRIIGGENHPYDFYATEPWQHPKLYDVPRRDEFDSERDSERDKARKIKAAKSREKRRQKFMGERLPVRVAPLRLKPELRKELLRVLDSDKATMPADQDYSRFAHGT